MGFHAWAMGALEQNHHESMSCFDGGMALVLAGRKSRTMKHALETRTSKPTTY
jgi:hypothetical protein